MNHTLTRSARSLLNPCIAIILSLIIGSFLIIPTGESPLSVYKLLFVGSLGSFESIAQSCAFATPLLFTGLGAAIAFKAGVFNIGLEGQLYFGAMASAICGVYLGFLPSIILIPLCLIVAMTAGALWGYIPAILNVKLDVNIFINCIMLNSVAQLFSNYLAAYPFKGELPLAATARIAPNAMLTKLAGPLNDINTGFLIALLLAVLLYIALFKTSFGYESRATGLNKKFSRFIGVNAGRSTIIIIMISGALAGLAGAERVMGVNYRYIADFSAGVGYTGIAVSLLARHNPLGCIITAIFFGALNNGAIQMEVSTSISRDLVSSIQAIMIIFMAAEYSMPRVIPYIKNILNKKNTSKEAPHA